jgi:hypothetical protein
MHRALHFAGWGFVAVSAALAAGLGTPAPVATAAAPVRRSTPNVEPSLGSSAQEWFRKAKPYCNPVEVAVVTRNTPAPSGMEGQGYRAACLALAGKIDDARTVIDALPKADRFRAAGIVFEVGHPVADAGDDRSAGPIMELVIDYWPNHYMALYHAGMSEYMLGQYPLAQRNLEQFLKHYKENDGWTSNAREVLGRLKDPKAAKDLRRPREPGQ